MSKGFFIGSTYCLGDLTISAWWRLTDTCSIKKGSIHRWTKRKWLFNCRVWIQKCEVCGDIQFYRGNNTVHIDIDQEDGVTNILTLLQPSPRWWQYPEFDEDKFLRYVLKEANLKIEGLNDV